MPREPDPYEAALQAACESLLELRLIDLTAFADPVLNEHVERAVSSLSFALDRMRAAGDHDHRALSFGFVIARGPSWG